MRISIKPICQLCKKEMPALRAGQNAGMAFHEECAKQSIKNHDPMASYLLKNLKR